MHQIEQLFGTRLCDAEERLTLLIALRADRLLAINGASSATASGRMP